MPIYAYKCTACGHAQDVLQKISDKTLTVCPECHQETYAKQVTAAGFQLKGSGWYVTDFRNNGGGDKGGSKTSEPAPAVTAADSAVGGSGEGASKSTSESAGSAGSSSGGSTAAGSTAGGSNAAGSTSGSSSSTSAGGSASSSTPASSSTASKPASGGSAA